WLGCHDTSVMIFAPYPGSEDFNRLVDAGKISITEDYYYVALSRTGRSANTYNPQMGRRELFLIQLAMLIAFYTVAYTRRPWRLWHVVRSVITGAEENIVDQTIRTKLRQFKNVRQAHAGRTGS
ncbi:MAG TPA: hypothetical protein VF921_20060, partial [Vicinamibacterales bacterium]